MKRIYKDMWLNAGALLLLSSFSQFASAEKEPKDWQVTLTADGVWASTKIRDVRDEDAVLPSAAVTLRHKLPYLPNARLRYTGLDSDRLQHDKTDATFFWTPLSTENLELDIGATFTHYANSFYLYSESEDSQGDFDDVIFSWFGAMAIRVPTTQLHLISEFDFGETSDIKTADVTAGLRYDFPLEQAMLSARVGYRVLDYTFNTFGNEAYGFADGWLVGIEVAF